ncbi:inositol monophosphatase family protein [Sagittula sp. SSi028]|uniref:inositol monophosphatase family protein n=1 Tax=Sagittula sp. SSi028 TaxID=3400636 RepID=UPI003AF9F89F
MRETDLDLLIRAARAAGQTACAFVGQELGVRDKDDGQGPVTQADLAVNDRLEQILRDARPHYGWLSEESIDDPARLTQDTVFVIDPIDGTRSFIEGARTWAHSLAIVRDGVTTAAVVFLPLLDRLYSAQQGMGAQMNGAPIAASARGDIEGADLLATKPVMAAEHWRGAVPQVTRHHRPSLAYRQCLVAEGRFDAMLTLRATWEWDIAAGALILSESGARVSDRRGSALRFNAPHPQTNGMVAANPALHDGLLQRLA